MRIYQKTEETAGEIRPVVAKSQNKKQRLKFAYEETGASVKNDKDMEKLNQMDTDGVNFRHQKQKEKAKKFSYEEAKKKKEAKQHSKKAQVYQANDGEAPGKKKSRLKFGEGESVKNRKNFCCQESRKCSFRSIAP